MNGGAFRSGIKFELLCFNLRGYTVQPNPSDRWTWREIMRDRFQVYGDLIRSQQPDLVALMEDSTVRSKTFSQDYRHFASCNGKRMRDQTRLVLRGLCPEPPQAEGWTRWSCAMLGW